MKKILVAVLAGKLDDPHKYVRPAIPNQWANTKAVWDNSKDSTFGIERIFRLFLALQPYLFPGLYVRHFSGLKGLLCRKLWLEAYVIFKVILPLCVLALHLDKYIGFQRLAIYLSIETLLYTLGLLFLSDIYKSPISYKRSYLMILINYAELCFNYAILYKGASLISNLKGGIDAIYFSFISAATIGYGDMVPVTRTGKIVVISQSLCTLVLVSLVFARVVSAFNDKNEALNKKRG